MSGQQDCTEDESALCRSPSLQRTNSADSFGDSVDKNVVPQESCSSCVTLPNESNAQKGYMCLRGVKLNFKPPRSTKTQAQHQAAYRERLKQDTEKWAEYQTMQRQRLKEWRLRQSEEKKAAMREKNKLRNRERRKKEKEERTLERRKRDVTKPIRKTRSAALECEQKKEYWRLQQQKRRAAMTPDQREREKQKRRERYQQKKSSSSKAVVDMCVQTASFSPKKQTKYNALSRVNKILPKCSKTLSYVLKTLLKKSTPTKKKQIYEELKREFRNEATPPKKQLRKQRKDSIAKAKIVSFYLLHSVDLPGKRQYSKRLKKQKKVLTLPIGSLYRTFLSENPEIKISKRTFFRCRPRHICPMKSCKFIQCLCDVCENAKLCLKGLQSAGTSLKCVDEALNASLCSSSGEWWNLPCILRQCSACGVNHVKQKLLAECCLRSTVTYRKWEQVKINNTSSKRTELVDKICTVDMLINIFCEMLYTLSLHVHTYKWQRHQFNSLKGDLPDGLALIVMDFAENYACKHQHEVQSAHWNLQQVTIHPVVVYSKCSICNSLQTAYHVFVSDDLTHDSNFVFTVLQNLLPLFSHSKFVIFSDNCSAQYKSKLPFHHMSLLSNQYTFERCFFGERHGKSECDSCGGLVKAFLSQAVASGRATLRNASEIFSFLNSSFILENSNCSHSERHFHFIKSSSVNRDIEASSLKTLPGTKKIHSLKVVSNEVLATRQFSCFCKFCLCGMSDMCSNEVGNYEYTKWPNAQKARPVDEVANGLEETGGKNVDENGVTVDMNEDDSGETNGCDVMKGKNVGEEHKNGTDVDVNESNDTDICDETESNNLRELEKAVELDKSEGKNDIHNEVEGKNACFEGTFLDIELDSSVHASESSILDTAFLEGDSPVVKMQQVKVRRKLFNDNDHEVSSEMFFETNKILSCPEDRHVFFDDMYKQLLACSTFIDLRNVCQQLVDKCNSYELTAHTSSTISGIRASVDKNAFALLPSSKPAGFLPVLTVGDGNCMPRAISTLAFGTEKFHKEVRCRIICELACNADLYTNEQYINTVTVNENTSDQKLPLIAFISSCHTGEDTNDPTVVRDIFEKETLEARRLNTHLGYWQLLAAASVLKCVLISLYPEKGSLKVRHLFHSSLLPRSDCEEKVVYVLWSSNRSDMNDTHWVANHVVPLIKCHQ